MFKTSPNRTYHKSTKRKQVDPRTCERDYSADEIEIMQALLQGDWQRADQATGAQLNEISGIVAAFTQWHLEKSLRSLPLVDRTSNLS